MSLYNKAILNGFIVNLIYLIAILTINNPIIMNKLLLSRRCTFSLRKYIYDSLYLNDPASQSEQIINSSIHTGIPNSNISTFNPVARNYQSTKLPSGITVLTESVGVPSNVNLGIFANVGSRD
jgi:hypothetical protein